MIGTILQMLMYNIAEDNTEELLKVLSKGGTFELDTGMIGSTIIKGINKHLGTNLQTNLGVKFAIDKAKQGMFSKGAGMALGLLGKYFFDPKMLAVKATVGMTFDMAKARQEDNMYKNIMNLPERSDSYKLDERFNMVQQNSLNNIEYLNHSINALLSKGNLAGDLLDKAIGQL